MYFVAFLTKPSERAKNISQISMQGHKAQVQFMNDICCNYLFNVIFMFVRFIFFQTLKKLDANKPKFVEVNYTTNVYFLHHC